MVKIQGPPDDERLHEMVQRLAAAHGLVLDITGWAYRTYDVYHVASRLGARVRVARVESLASTSGEITVFDDRGLAFARALAGELEQAFGIGEALIQRQ